MGRHTSIDPFTIFSYHFRPKSENNLHLQHALALDDWIALIPGTMVWSLECLYLRFHVEWTRAD